VKIWPTRRQWKAWSLPTKYGVVSLLLGLLSLIVVVMFYLYPGSSGESGIAKPNTAIPLPLTSTEPPNVGPTVFHDRALMYILPMPAEVSRGERVTMSVVLYPGDHDISYLKIPLKWQPDALEDFQVEKIDTGIGVFSGTFDSSVGKGFAEIDIGFGLYGPFKHNRDSRVVLSFSLRAVGKQGSRVEIMFGPEAQALSSSQWDKANENVLDSGGTFVDIQ
jgi:hypothetical protein